MRPMEPIPAVTLCSSDIPGDDEYLLGACEDCACAVSGTAAKGRLDPVSPPRRVDGRRWVLSSDVIRVPLGQQQTALFNPAGNGGVVVVNDPARRICDSLNLPATARAVLDTFPPRVGGVEASLARLSQAQIIHPVDLEPRQVFAESDQVTAWIHVTNACNLRCSYCYVAQSSETISEATGRAAIEAVIASAVAHRFGAVRLKYAGGEASLTWRLMQFLHRHAQDLAQRWDIRLSAVLLTNGVRLAPELIDWLRSEGIGLAVSLDGKGDYHDAQRPRADGRPSSGMVETTIAQLRERGLSPHLSITITNRNAAGLADLVRFSLDHELTFSVNFYRPARGRAADLRCSDRDLLSALEQALDVLGRRLPRWSLFGSLLDRGQLLTPRTHACGAGQDYLVIDHRGRLTRCHMVMDQVVDDVFSGNDLLSRIRRPDPEELNPSVDRRAGCDRCTWRYWCSGGCALATRQAMGTATTRSPYCDVYRQLYPQALRLEGLRLLRYAVAPS